MRYGLRVNQHKKSVIVTMQKVVQVAPEALIQLSKRGLD